jgi:hypothetical protein
MLEPVDLGPWKLSRYCAGGIRLPRKLENQKDKVMAGLARLQRLSRKPCNNDRALLSETVGCMLRGCNEIKSCERSRGGLMASYEIAPKGR